MKKPILITVIALVSLFAAWAILSILHVQISFASGLSLPTKVVHPGDAFDVNLSFTYENPGSYLFNAMTITDQARKNWFLSYDYLYKNVAAGGKGPTTNPADIKKLNSVGGFVDPDYYHSVTTGYFYIEPYSTCPLGLGPPPFPPPAHATDHFSIMVLPATPAGHYTIHIPKSFYCFSGPTGSLNFEVRGESTVDVNIAQGTTSNFNSNVPTQQSSNGNSNVSTNYPTPFNATISSSQPTANTNASGLGYPKIVAVRGLANHDGTVTLLWATDIGSTNTVSYIVPTESSSRTVKDNSRGSDHTATLTGITDFSLHTGVNLTIQACNSDKCTTSPQYLLKL